MFLHLLWFGPEFLRIVFVLFFFLSPHRFFFNFTVYARCPLSCHYCQFGLIGLSTFVSLKGIHQYLKKSGHCYFLLVFP